MLPHKKVYFTIRDKILIDVVSKIEKLGSKIFSLRCGTQIVIRGAGRFYKKELDGRLTWRGREVVENFEKLSSYSLYFLTEDKVWKVNSVDKRNPLRIDSMCKAWLMPHEIEAWETKQKEKASLKEEVLKEKKVS